MKRRTALKNLGLSFGALTLTPSVMSMLQSCQSTATSWTPSFFSAEMAAAIDQLTELILPATATIPGAKELQLVRFIDSHLLTIANETEQNFILMAVQLFLDHCRTSSEKTGTTSLSDEDLEGQLAYFLRASAEDKAKRSESFNRYRKAVESGEKPTAPVEGTCHVFLHNLRNLTVGAFKGHETIAKEHMVYLPVPGHFKGCVDLQEATQGKIWAL